MLLSRRRALQALAVLVSTPASLPWAAADTLADRQLLAAQILNGVTPASLSVVDDLFAELTRELGQGDCQPADYSGTATRRSQHRPAVRGCSH
ncbi:MAG: hypothetical protein R3F53_00815 [Gammaproteobacteria bacterium]